MDEEILNKQLLPCDHYEYEYRLHCNVFGRIKRFLRANESDSEYTCDQLKDFFIACAKYRDDPQRNLESYIKLQPYENELLKKRLSSIKQNNVWKLRNQNPPSDWNAPLPDW